VARKYLTPIDLTGLELTNFKVQNLATDPTPYGKGHTYYNTTHNELRTYNGAIWMPVGGSVMAGATGSRPAAGNAGRLYFDTTLSVLFYDNGTTWTQDGVSQSDLSSAISAATIANTDGLSEGTTNLYFTTARAREALSASGGISYNSSTGVFSANYTAIESQLVTDGFAKTSNIPSLSGYVTETGVETLSNKTFSGDTYFQSSGGAGGTNNYLSVNNGTGKFTVHSGYALDLSSSGDINIVSNGGDIVLNPGSTYAYIGSVTDAHRIATRSYVDGVAQGLSVKNSVAAATTANIALDGSVSTLDGHIVVTGDRILVKNQSTASQNGIYVASTTGAWTRATDEQTPAKGDFVFVESGTANGKTGWILSDTTGGNYTWTQFSAAGEYTAGNGIDISGNSIAVKHGAGLTFSGSDLVANVGGGLYTDTYTGAISVNAGTGITITGGSQVALDTNNGYGVRKYAATIGDGSATSYDVTHNFGTRDVEVTVYDAATYEEVVVDVTRTSTTKVTIGFAVAPSANSYRVVVVG
jgi:hypothetical protein